VTTTLLAACLIAGAVAIGWPGRHRLVIHRPRNRAASRVALPRIGDQNPRRMLVASIGAVAALGLLAGGPVAAVVGAVYAALAARALLRRSTRRRATAERSTALDHLAALAADLRAGSAPAISPDPAAGFAPGGGRSGGDRIAGLTASVWRLAERTGAPAADLVERIEADARAADRAAASAAAQAAGAQATALLLAGLPVGGIGLGVAIGVDPVRVLLHTPLGAACAVGAVLLQGGGLLWADRLAAGVAR
jgi:tight adherence protein B